MLRRAENVRLSRSLFGRVTVQVGEKRYTLKRRLTKDKWSADGIRQQSQPILVFSTADRNLWQFQNRFYWDNDSLDVSQVYALLVTRNQGEQQLASAEYQTLRAEIVARIQKQQDIMNFSVLVVTAILSYAGLTKLNSHTINQTVAVLGPPTSLALSVFGLMTLDHEMNIAHATRYIYMSISGLHGSKTQELTRTPLFFGTFTVRSTNNHMDL